MNKNLRFLFASSKWGGSAYHRMYLPSIHLRKISGIQSLISTDYNYNMIETFKPHAIFFQWLSGEKSLTFVRWCQSKNIKVFIDIDDDIWSLEDNSEWTKEKIESLEQIIRQSDGIVVASNKLEEIIRERKLHENVVISGNYVDLDSFDDKYIREYIYETRVGWYGSSSHEQDFSDAICDWLIKYFKADDLIVFGHMPAKLEGYARFIEGVEPLKFMQTLQRLNLDMGLIICDPMIEFNKAKTPIKLLEMAVLGIPILSSLAEPYLPFKDYIGIYEENDFFVEKSKVIKLQKLVKNEYSWQARKEDVYKTYKELYDNVV